LDCEVGVEADGAKQSVNVVTINRPDNLDDIADLGLSLAEGKRGLAGLQREIRGGRRFPAADVPG
jgi:hypothetical protein